MGIGREWLSSAQHQVWLSNGEYRVVVPKQKQIPVVTRERFTMIVRRFSSRGRQVVGAGHASRPAADPIAVHGSVPAGRTVARRRRLASDVRDQVAMGRVAAAGTVSRGVP